MEWIRDHMWESWLILAVGLAIAEMLSFEFVMLMFAAGSLLAMVAALAGLSGVAQVLIGLVSSVALLGLLRPSLMRVLHRGPDLLVGPEALVGRPALCLSPIRLGQPGRVKIGGDEWTAVSVDDALNIPADTALEVVEIRGAMAVVRPAANEIAQ